MGGGGRCEQRGLLCPDGRSAARRHGREHGVRSRHAEPAYGYAGHPHGRHDVCLYRRAKRPDHRGRLSVGTAGGLQHTLRRGIYPGGGRRGAVRAGAGLANVFARCGGRSGKSTGGRSTFRMDGGALSGLHGDRAGHGSVCPELSGVREQCRYGLRRRNAGVRGAVQGEAGKGFRLPERTGGHEGNGFWRRRRLSV